MKYFKKLKKVNDQKGFSLLLTLLIAAVVLVISLSISALMVAEIKMVGAYDDSVVAYYAADAGIEDALLTLSKEEKVDPYSQTDPPKFDITTEEEANVIPGSLKQDESVEVASSESNPPNEVNISWNSNPPGTDEAGLEWTLIPYTKTGGVKLYPEKIGKGFYNSKTKVYDDNDINQTYFSVQAAAQPGYSHGITINITEIETKPVYFKLRVKCLAEAESGDYEEGKYKIDYQIQAVNGEIRTGGYTIGSMGESNNVKRKVEVETDVGKAGIVGIFDYVLYSEKPLDKPPY